MNNMTGLPKRWHLGVKTLMLLEEETRRRNVEAPPGSILAIAVSPLRRKIGVLLNLPGVKLQDAKSRGRIVADFMKSDVSADQYVEGMKSYFADCNEFVFVTVGFESILNIQTYTNATDKLCSWEEDCLGFGNSLPEEPLEKVKAGRETLKHICSQLKKTSDKEELVNKLVGLLKSEERHLPDPILEAKRPGMSQFLSSIFVSMPEGRYGTRTHTVILVTKSGQMEVLELTLQSPVDLTNPQWTRTEYQFTLSPQGGRL